MTLNKFDFFSILKRRKIDVGRWLADEKIVTLDEYVKWTQTNASKYIFTEDLATEVLNVLGNDSSVPPVAQVVVEVTPSTQESLRAGEDFEKRNRKRKNAFQQLNNVSPVSGSSSEPDDVE